MLADEFTASDSSLVMTSRCNVNNSVVIGARKQSVLTGDALRREVQTFTLLHVPKSTSASTLATVDVRVMGVV